MKGNFNIQEEVNLETKRVVETFLNEDLTIIELASKCHMTINKTLSRLRNSYGISLLYPSNSFNIMQKIKEKMDLMEKKKANGDFLNLNVFYKDPQNQKKILIHLALTFRAKSQLIKDLFNVNLRDLMGDEDYNFYNISFLYLENFDDKDQEVAKKQILDFYNNFLESAKSRNTDKIKGVLRQITDYKASELQKNHIIGSPYTEDDYLTLLNYQLKYSLTNAGMNRLFSIDEDHYKRKIQVILEKEEYSELRRRFEHLQDFNSFYYIQSRRHG